LCAEGPWEGFRDKRPRRGGRRLPSSTERNKKENRGVYPHRAEPVKAPRRLGIEFNPEDLRLDGNERGRLSIQECSQREREEARLRRFNPGALSQRNRGLGWRPEGFHSRLPETLKR